MYIPFLALRLLLFDAVHELDAIFEVRRYFVYPLLLCILRQTIIQTVYPCIPFRPVYDHMEWNGKLYLTRLQMCIIMRVYTGLYGYTVVYRFV